MLSEHHGAKFIAIADYLNSAYEQMGQERGTAGFLVQLTVEQIGDAFVPRFTVVSRPNTWRVAVPYCPSVADPDPTQTALFADWFIDAMRSPESAIPSS